ncbi:MAG: endonuclease III [Bacteroidota bacterium]|nr:endonuclease III [Bacteroidota bacterium]MDP4231739.1 endonuclease III [Bacteroidota bacterium]MDP4243475.1 endonuclease III [Bacteroidota bacterium]MDP4289360.1 endonuclease III [Bacteroidota bacterium]
MSKQTLSAAPRDGALAPRRLPSGESFEERTTRFQKIFTLLHKAYPDARCALEFTDAYELLAATILSAQCTDKRVNMVMPEFRKAFPNAKKLANAELADIEDVIKTTGFFRQKAKSLKSMASDIVETFGGSVPDTMEQLITLRGVGRKTANVVLGDAFGKAEGIAVDTHVTRLSGRLGLTKETEPVKIEQDLMKLAKPTQWTLTAHVIILHGRAICDARKPKCTQCVVAELCPSAGMKGSV